MKKALVFLLSIVILFQFPVPALADDAEELANENVKTEEVVDVADEPAVEEVAAEDTSTAEESEPERVHQILTADIYEDNEKTDKTFEIEGDFYEDTEVKADVDGTEYKITFTKDAPKEFSVKWKTDLDIEKITSDDSDVEFYFSDGEYEFKLAETTFKIIVKEETEQANSEEGQVTEETVSIKSSLLMTAGEEAETYNIVVNYIYGDNSIAHEPYVVTLLAGEDYEATITTPTLPGYESYYQDVAVTTITLSYTNIQSNQTVYVQYRPVMVSYQVRHYWQNADNDGYTLHETEDFMGYTGDIVEAEAKTYEGFAVISYETPTIAADGSTVVEIKYDREYSLLKFNLNGGYGVDPIYAKWGSTIPSIQDPQRNGYTFAGWDKEIPATMPYGGDTLTAQWTAIGSEYTVIYWKQNADNDDYSYWGSENFTATTGALVSGSNSISSDIAGDDINYFTFNSTLTDSDVEVLGDGSTIVNVYYDRNVYTITLIVKPTHTHSRTCYTSSTQTAGRTARQSLNSNYTATTGMVGAYNGTKYVYVGNSWYVYTGTSEAGTIAEATCGNTYTVIHTITAKYGQDISDEWTFTGEDGVEYPTTNPISSWYPYQSSIYTYRIYRMQIMPGENSIFYLYTSSNAQRTYYYYVEALSTQTPDITYDGVDYILYYTLNHDFNYWTRTEDFYDYDGFTQKYAKTSSGTTITGSRYPSSGSLSSGEELYMYYTRNTYGITYQSNGGTLTEDADGNSLTTSTYTEIPYQTSLSTYNITPPYPDAFPIGAYTFDGWYDNADCEGEAFDFSTETMPASNKILFAKWTPTYYQVSIYRDLVKANEGTDPLDSYYAPYGSTLETPAEPTPEYEEYVFVGWFYFDEDTETEMPWVFGSTEVSKNVKIYAKWSSSSIRPYNIYFQDANGNDLTTPIHSSGYAGTTRTFTASASVPAGYFPRVKSHSIIIDIEGTDENGLNDYVFVYDEVSPVPYTVHYVDARTGESLIDDKVVEDNVAIRVTEKFVQIAGYVPDAFQKHLTVSIGDANEITFYYTQDSVHAFYITSHYIEQVDGSWTLYNVLETWATIGDSVTATPMSIDGYTLDTTIEGTVQNGTVTAEGLEMTLYYARKSYAYKVKYIDSRTGLALHDEKISTGKIDTTITETAEDIEGYDCTNGPTISMVIQLEDDPEIPVRNVITFYYQVQQAQFIYVPVGEGTVDNESEYVAAYAGTALGSTATANEGYRLGGWYTDEECTTPVTATDGIINGNKFTPSKQGDRYYTATYYAKFVPDSTTIDVEKEGSDGATDLSGAFALYKVGGADSIEYNGTDVNVSLEDSFITPNQITLENGNVYYIIETAAPLNYDLWLGALKVTIDESGNITVEDDDEGYVYAEYADGVLTLYDEPTPVVPSGFTQDSNPYMLMVVISIIIFLAIYLCEESKEKE